LRYCQVWKVKGFIFLKDETFFVNGESVLSLAQGFCSPGLQPGETMITRVLGALAPQLNRAKARKNLNHLLNPGLKPWAMEAFGSPE
jgi:hypothetical protein